MRRLYVDREDDTAPGKRQPRRPKKGLHFTARLDDGLGGESTFEQIPRMTGLREIAAVPVRECFVVRSLISSTTGHTFPP
jgi:hypothetical protein